MLLLLPPELRENVLSHVTSAKRRLNVLSACKALRPKQPEHPTHTELSNLTKDCYLNYVPFDDPFLLQLYRKWKTPHTHNALIHWVLNQRIDIDEGGFYAQVPWRCTLYNTEGVQCLRMRVQLWDRVNTSRTCTMNRYGDKRIVWQLLDGTQARAYMPLGN